VVPAQNFGRSFIEWREGDPACVSSKGKAFKGRKCASKLNKEYRYMQADMYNLFPAIGSVNALRSNYNFVATVNTDSDFGSCAMKIDKRKVEPPSESMGRIARTYMYMHEAYPQYKMSKQQKQLMAAWDRLHPTSLWECQRYKRIKSIQNNDNKVMAQRCNNY
jgi:deoxyribonuclease-1